MKKILVINFFPAFVPPTSGGELRYFNIYKNLSKYYDISLLSPTYSHHKQEVIKHSNSFREYRIPKEPIHDKLHYEIEQEKIGLEFSALVCALSANYPNKYHESYLKLYFQSDIIIHDFPYMLNYDLFFGFDDKPRIYNSHNHETSLVKQMLSGPNANKYIAYIYNLERQLVLNADIVFATSEEERDTFIHEFGISSKKVQLAPNGINKPKTNDKSKIDPSARIKTFFIGSAHPPNVEAVDFIINELSNNCPSVDFYIAGTCCDKTKSKPNSNTYLLGLINEQEKEELFRGSYVAINPMFSGAGTNLKTLEFLSNKCPLISTSVGVRGIGLIDMEHYINAEKDDFVDKINKISEINLERIAKSGQEYVKEKFSWRVITENILLELNKLSLGKRKKTIVLLNDFEVSNPTSGGEIRINRLYSHLTKYYKVLLVCLNNNGVIKRTVITPDFIEISLPKTDAHIEKEFEMNSKFWISANDIISSQMCLSNKILTNVVQNIESSVDFVVFEHPYLSPLLSKITNENIIYESLNCEYKLKESLLVGHPEYKNLIQQTRNVEKDIFKKSNYTISCSNDDHESLKELCTSQKEIFTVQNGIDIPTYEQIFSYPKVKAYFTNHPVIAFIGSGHKPNIDALQFIIDNLAQKHLNCYFVIIGTVCDAVSYPIPKNVLLFGRLKKEEKDILLSLADIAINPIFSGSGSNLKLAEYFAKKVPVVTTSCGGRGYHIKDRHDALICSKSEFSVKICELIKDENLRHRIIKNAFLYAKKYLDWHVLAEKYHIILNNKVCKDNKKILFVTYRYTEPPLGGAEMYLSKVVNELSKLNIFKIDLVTLDIFDIHNAFHFSANYSIEQSDNDSLNVDFNIIKLKSDRLQEEQQFKNSKKLFSVWMSEFRKSSIKFIKCYSEPILMGGWHFPEVVNERAEVWSSEEAYIYIKNINEIEISAYSPKKLKITIFADNNLIFDKNKSGNFCINIDVVDSNILKIFIKPLYGLKRDPRQLGIKVNNISFKMKGIKTYLKLDYNYRDYLKDHYFEEYIDELINVANDRDPYIDKLFQETRGPLSNELESWLDKNIKNYDLVVGHSIPFRTSVLSVNYAKKYNKPVVLLPHFHFDDEFYHWNSYYKALKDADCVLAAPEISIPLFFDKIQAKTKNVLGGGVSEKEYEIINTSFFKIKYSSSLPFFLVLGRKSSAKNYQWIIEAVNSINKKKKICNLVIIGRDEDEKPVSKTDAIYLGEQSREVVLGAIKECSGIVNMSNSESFGIVIIEAWMLKKIPIVNKNCPAFAELVTHQKNGLLAEKNNLSKVLKSILENNHNLEKIGQCGYSKAVRSYTWKAIAMEISASFNKVLKDSKVA